MLGEPLTGQRWVEVPAQRIKREWAQQFKELVDERFPAAERIVLVQDNLNTYSPATLYATFPAAGAKRLADKLELHYTLEYGSWPSMTEIEFGVLSRQGQQRRVPARETLGAELAA